MLRHPGSGDGAVVLPVPSPESIRTALAVEPSVSSSAIHNAFRFIKYESPMGLIHDLPELSRLGKISSMHATNRSKPNVALTASCFAVACVGFAWLWFDYRAYWLDDAFITFRYSLNLATGAGPVYNVGEAVEGYTSFLWMLLAAIPFAVIQVKPALLAIKALAFVASLWVLYRVWTFPSPTGSTRRWGVLILATQPVFILNCGDGMETPLFLVLMVECLLALQRSPGRTSGTVVGLVTAGMILTRPEALPLLVALPALVWFAHREKPEQAGDVRDWLGGFVVAGLGVVVVHEMFRWGYYGHPFPNTYYAKATGTQVERLASGVRDISRFMFENPWRAPVAIWVALGFALVATRRLALRLDSKVVLWLGALWLMIVFRVSFDLWSGSAAMGRHRFLAPLLVPLMILADEGARMLWRGTGRYVVVALCALCLYYNVTGHLNHEWSIGEYRKGLERGHIALGTWLRETYPPEILIAVGDAGTIPFYSGMTTVDMWGLNDATIARLPGAYGVKPGMPDYVMSRQPDVIVLWNQVEFVRANAGKLVAGSEIDRQLVQHPSFKRDYRFVREYVFRKHAPNVPGYYLNVFEHQR
jgi:arabinofuranosyltransferase